MKKFRSLSLRPELQNEIASLIQFALFPAAAALCALKAEIRQVDEGGYIQF